MEVDEKKSTEEIKTEEKYEEVVIKKTKKEESGSYFDGRVIELIGYKLLRLIITIFTIGIAKPWADCMIIGYKVNHTVLNGERLKFEGTGGSLFVQRFKWIFFTIITLGIYAFFVPVKKLKWIVSYIHFENKDLITGESLFEGSTFKLIGINILSSVFNTITLGLASAFTDCIKLRWIASKTIINKRRIVFDGNSISLFGHYMLWFLLTCSTLGIFGLWLDVKYNKWYVKNSHIKLVGEDEEKIMLNPIIMALVLVLGVACFSLLIKVGYDILLTEPTNPEVKIQEIETVVNNASVEVNNIVHEKYQRRDIEISGEIQDLNAFKDIYKKGARGNYFYNVSYYEKRDETSHFLYVSIFYDGYLCSKYSEIGSDKPLECRYVNLENIIEDPSIVPDFLETVIYEFYW